jgi:hypothetical protein
MGYPAAGIGAGPDRGRPSAAPFLSVPAETPSRDDRDVHNQVIMAGTYPPRIQAFRDSMIKGLPRTPNDKASRASLEAMPTRRLILAFITWRMRLIPAKPRKVSLWAGGVTPLELHAAEPRLRPLLKKIEAGKDLTPHLSDLVMTKGVVLPGANPADRGKDIDAVLTRHSLHHFHVGVVAPSNPKGRSGVLIFAEVLDKEFRIIAISDHGAFEQGSDEQLRFFGICDAYAAKDVPHGQAFMGNPVMSSGHSLVVTLFADRCEDQIERLDPELDDPAFIGSSLLGMGRNVLTPVAGGRVFPPTDRPWS